MLRYIPGKNVGIIRHYFCVVCRDYKPIMPDHRFVSDEKNFHFTCGKEDWEHTHGCRACGESMDCSEDPRDEDVFHRIECDSCAVWR